jgi:hypothetical protein
MRDMAHRCNPQDLEQDKTEVILRGGKPFSNLPQLVCAVRLRHNSGGNQNMKRQTVEGRLDALEWGLSDLQDF